MLWGPPARINHYAEVIVRILMICYYLIANVEAFQVKLPKFKSGRESVVATVAGPIYMHELLMPKAISWSPRVYDRCIDNSARLGINKNLVNKEKREVNMVYNC